MTKKKKITKSGCKQLGLRAVRLRNKVLLLGVRGREYSLAVAQSCGWSLQVCLKDFKNFERMYVPIESISDLYSGPSFLCDQRVCAMATHEAGDAHLEALNTVWDSWSHVRACSPA